MGRADELKARHDKASGRMRLHKKPAFHDDGRKAKTNTKPIVLVVALLLVAGGLTGWWLRRGGDSAEELSAVEERYRSAVGLVVAVVPREDGEHHVPFATAWAYKTDRFATNAHVVEQARKFIEEGRSVYVVLNHEPDQRFPVTSLIRHARFGSSRGRGQNDPVPFAFDVGCLVVEGTLPVCFPVASRRELLALKAGDPIGYIGFPMENLVKGGVDVRSPVAIMQSGIITAVSDFWQGNSGKERNQLIRHNLGVTGGGSGSPIFNPDGKVVAILNAGNMAGQLTGFNDEGKPVFQRTPSAVMINFAQRVDLLNELQDL